MLVIWFSFSLICLLHLLYFINFNLDKNYVVKIQTELTIPLTLIFMFGPISVFLTPIFIVALSNDSQMWNKLYLKHKELYQLDYESPPRYII